MGFQSPFVRNTQVSLPLAVIFQAKERQPRTGKGKLPLRQNRRSDIQNPANRSGVFFCIQQQKRTGALPDKRQRLSCVRAPRRCPLLAPPNNGKQNLLKGGRHKSGRSS